jgi:hypothetical protein
MAVHRPRDCETKIMDRGVEMKKAGTAVLLLLLAAMAGCGELLQPGYSYARVQVEVTDPGGEPLRGVSLILYTGQRHMAYGTTDFAGRHSFNFVPAGSYGVAAALQDGFALPEGEVNFRVFDVEEGETREVSIVLIRSEVSPGAAAGS